MTFYTDVIDSIPIGVQMTTTEIARNYTKSTGREIHSWEWRSLMSRIHKTMTQAMRNDVVQFVGFQASDGNNRVGVWIRQM